MDDLPFGEPLTGPNAGAAPPRKCTHPRQFRSTVVGEVAGITVNIQKCGRCGRSLDPAAQRAGRRNRRRGGAAELTVARAARGEKVGPLGHPYDVVLPGYMRLQVKKLTDWPSLNNAVKWIDAMAVGSDMRGVAIIQALGPGVRGRRLLILDLDEFSRWHGDPTKGEVVS